MQNRDRQQQFMAGSELGSRRKWARLVPLALAGLCVVLLAASVKMASEEARSNEQARENTRLLLQAAQATHPVQAASPAQEQTAQTPSSGGIPREAALQDVDGYSIIAKLTIDKLSLELPVIGKTTDAALKIAPCLYSGPSTPADAGNMVIAAHNNKDGSQFGKLRTLKVGDAVEMMDKWGAAFTYEVYDIKTIEPDNVAILGEYEGERALSLLTCTSNGNRRLLLRCRMVNS